MPRHDDSPKPSRLEEYDESANPGCNLYIANLSYRTTDSDLESFFSKYGTLKSCKIIKDPTDNRSRGFGFVTFSSVEEADNVVKTLTSCELDGRTIRIEKARRAKPYTPTPGKYMGHSHRREGTDQTEHHRHSHSPRYRSRSPRRRSYSRSPPRRSRNSRSPRR